MFDRLVLERRQSVSRKLSGGVFAGSIAVSLAFSGAILVAAGVPASALFDEVIVQVFFTASGLAQTLTMATPMVLFGLSAAMALRLRFWNIGIEGQVLLGAIFASVVALYADFGAMQIPVMMVAAAFGGAIWIAIPLILRERAGVSEVVVCLLLSSIAYLLLQHLLFGPLGDPAKNFPTSKVFDPVSHLTSLGFGNTHTGLIIAIVLAALFSIILQRTRLGFFGRMVGDNPSAAQANGFPVVLTTAVFILISGATAGLAGGVIVAGTEFRLTQYVGLHATFSGIVVAVLARNNATGVMISSFFVAGVFVAGNTLKVFYGMSEGVVLVIQGVVLLTVISGQFLSTFKLTVTPGDTTLKRQG